MGLFGSKAPIVLDPRLEPKVLLPRQTHQVRAAQGAAAHYWSTLDQRGRDSLVLFAHSSRDGILAIDSSATTTAHGVVGQRTIPHGDIRRVTLGSDEYGDFWTVSISSRATPSFAFRVDSKATASAIVAAIEALRQPQPPAAAQTGARPGGRTLSPGGSPRRGLRKPVRD